MITKEEAHRIAQNYIEQKKRQFTTLEPIEKVLLRVKEILYGIYEGKEMSVYIVPYYVLWGADEKALYINIAADTGEVLYTITPHGYEEDME